jgi:hypothetical protein
MAALQEGRAAVAQGIALGDGTDVHRRPAAHPNLVLYEFMAEHRQEILEECQRKIREVAPNPPTDEELENSIPEFFDEVVAVLRADSGLPRETPPAEASKSAEAHGRQRLGLGFTISGVVHDYGSLCHSITDACSKHGVYVSAREYQLLNQVLDAGISEAVTEFTEQASRDRDLEIERKANQHLGFVAHELRNALTTAMLSYDAIRTGQVAIGGRTSQVLERSLRTLRSLIDRSLTEVRLKSGLPVERAPARLLGVLEEVRNAGLMADRHEIAVVADAAIICSIDRHLITSACSNLLQNAVKYSPAGTKIEVRGFRRENGIVIEVEDECGGLPGGKLDRLFSPFVRGEGSEGLGLGLAIARQAAEVHGGTIAARNLPGKGCVFSIVLPDIPVAEAPSHTLH